ncbi:dipeptidyl-peptidase 8-like serine peptidase [Trypanosoma theileri]|uniref:Dipeptidyl-peptidase 8-like serine peptidase n=1 Tax=Trypanosoma theileri TaxID=67003 RepID=A0A1X0NDT3_9TRYP|nr:dipeptidyl-peptidase 8-like serine peptidase [Trypanosoma theileri]ORC81582.1 dipeptidyl-peptidase 8-like serine peptidase [Trypanosoma theileri]
MSKLPLKTYVEALRSFDTSTTGPGKPQQLSIINQQLYWLQGMNQELFTVSLEDTNAVPTRVILREEEEETAQKSIDESRPISKEEELLRERLRRRVTGISSYRVRSYDKAVFFTSGTNMFLYYPSRQQAPLKIFDYIHEETRKRFFSTEGKPFLCIQHLEHVHNSLPSEDDEHTHTNMLNIITFIYDSNLYRATITEQQDDTTLPPLIVDVESITTFGDKLHECGTADYIMQEEFSRYTGHYSTDHYVLFTYTDTSMLRLVSLLDGTDNSSIEEMMYCRVGDPNARSVIVVYELKDKRYRVIPRDAINTIAPWAEYIPRFGFKDHHTIYFSLLSRTQEQYCVLSCPIESLPVVEVNEIAKYFSDENTHANSNTHSEKDTSHLNKKQGSTSSVAMPTFTIEWEQSIPWAWVEVKPGPPIIFGNDYDITVCHASDTPTAHYHIFVRKSGTDKNAWRPLTQGEWNVKPDSLWVISDRVIFIANAGNRIGNILFSVPLQISEQAASEDQLTRLSPLNEHVYNFTVKNGLLCYVAGTASQPPELYQTTLHNTTVRHLIETKWYTADVTGEKEKIKTSSSIKLDDLVIPTIITTVNRRGVPLSGRLFVSPHVVPGKPAPLAIYVYGGPHVQLVYENDYDGTCKAIFQLLVKMGISVLVADGQMSNANGLRDLSICKHNMGNFETSDYVDFARYISSSSTRLPCGLTVDPARLAVFGWSYGGYATLLAMSQAADVFKIGFAGAPVGDWRLYDTGYTERYMGELYTTEGEEKEEEEERKEGAETGKEGKRKIMSQAYLHSTIANFVSGFPDDLNRVFIAHGLLDENVHFFNTCAVINAMIEEGKPYHIVLYPGERHGLMKKKASRLHHDAMIVKTLVEML